MKWNREGCICSNFMMESETNPDCPIHGDNPTKPMFIPSRPRSSDRVQPHAAKPEVPDPDDESRWEGEGGYSGSRARFRRVGYIRLDR